MAASLAKNVLRNRAFFDGVVLSDGDPSFLAMLAGAEPKDTPNLVYRDASSAIVFRGGSAASPATLTPLNYSLIDLAAYAEESRRLHPKSS